MVGDCCLIILILLLPPLGVFLMKGCNSDFWINVCLTILGYLPGHLHAFYVLVKDREQRQQQQQIPPPPPGYGAVPTQPQ
ncbi:UPF0057-domain-containing protein [Lichtheimia hyalospora FSU 10163]|uniref:Plasma membrane proteolipid 3 n=2 Tax=Lichtheimia TaxID=688353 RepID=A0AAD7UU48_9FUNG|nr:uncharacterized protein O0I10_012057 [Lichtheimia ornata]KAI7886297.1 UPF0057-domain-containing protein [Lichtheimia hyalospora FSU 10163]KAJ8652331.1 hypothetical protein O0I10_012057 [Lichtheimia ornata]CDS06221.1 hypothetical protein LRAMOSA08749 [Lichtheimia ramosa]